MRLPDYLQETLWKMPQRSKWYLSVERGVTMFEARVDGDHASGSTEIQLKDITGDPDDAVFGMTVSFHSAAVNDRKVSAVFLSYDDGTGVLKVGPNASNMLDDHYVTVYSSMHLWRLNEPDWDGEQHISPFSIMGPARGMFTDQTIQFIGANSYSPIGRSLTDPRWALFGDLELRGGSLTALNTVSSPLLVGCPNPGEKIIRLKTEDTAGEITRAIRPIFVHPRTGDGAPYSNIIINSCRGSDTVGWSINMTVYGAANRDLFPPKARIVLWAEDWYGDEKISIGGPFLGQGEVIFDGWIRNAKSKINYEEQSVTFDADSIDWFTKRLAMPDFVFKNRNDTTSWHKFADLTLCKAVVHMAQNHTTIPRMADFFSATFEYQIDKLPVPQNNFHAQVTQSVVQACFGRMAGSRFGSITVARDKNTGMRNHRERLKRAAVVLTRKDWMNLDIVEERGGGSSLVTLAGRLGDDTPVAAQFPVNGPSQSGDVEDIPGLIFKNLEQAADMAGLIYRRGNRNIRTITIALPNYRFMEPAFQETFAVFLRADENPKGYTWTHGSNGIYGKEFFVTDMELVMKDNSILVNIIAASSIYGTDGEAWVVPPEPEVLEDVPGYDQNPTDGATGIE